ncbi:MAG TPA: hypothetical protein VNO33_21975 [Kofleriaceae bacterium]|nr:hypothetical protein [Kofleriaceae bacterium]
MSRMRNHPDRASSHSIARRSAPSSVSGSPTQSAASPSPCS